MYCLPFRRVEDKEGAQDDSMVAHKRRGGRLESGRKGGRNKSSASNRGRASARFYSRTLNSIAIGFSWPPLVRSPSRPARSARARRPLCLFPAPRPPISRNTSVVSYTWKPYYKRHDKIPRRRRRPGSLLVALPAPRLWTLTGRGGEERRNDDRAPSSAGTFKDCTWEGYIFGRCGVELFPWEWKALYRTVRDVSARSPTLRVHGNFGSKSTISFASVLTVRQKMWLVLSTGSRRELNDISGRWKFFQDSEMLSVLLNTWGNIRW